jgi:hypothetical protein
VTTLDTSSFDAPLQLVRMGQLFDTHVLLRYVGDPDPAAIPITADEHRLLKGLDPAAFDYKGLRPGQRASVLDLIERDLIRAVEPTDGFRAYSWALDVTAPITVMRSPFEPGYMCVAQGRSFDLTEMANPLLDAMDGVRTVADVTAAMQDRVLSAPDGRGVIESAREAGTTFYVQLCDAGMSLTRGLVTSGAATAIPARRVVEVPVAA